MLKYFRKFVKLFKSPLFILILIISSVLVFAYKDVFFNNKIAFPSNYSAFFYSPWSTTEFPGWGHRIPNKPIGTDLVRFFYPNWEFAISEINEGRIPLWNPHVFSGNVFLANFQSAIFYPPNWLYFILPQLTAWSILHFIPFYIAGIGTYLFARKIKISPSGAILSAIAFSLSGFMIVWVEENTVVPSVAAFLPLLLLMIENYKSTLNRRYLILFSIIWAISFLAGHLQTNFYITLMSFIYFAFRILFDEKIKKITKIKSLSWFISFFILGIGISAIQLLPSLEAFLYSARPSVDSFLSIKDFFLPFSHLLKIFIPDWEGNPGAYNYFGSVFYHETAFSIGAASLVFAIFAILNKYKFSSLTKFFFIFSLIAFFFTSDNTITKFILSQNLPLISTFIPSRIVLLISFSFSILAGIGLSTYLDTKHKRKHLFFIMLSLIFLIIFINTFNLIFYYFDNKMLLLGDSLRVILEKYKSTNYFISFKNSLIPLVSLLALVAVIKFNKKYIIYSAILLTCLSQVWMINKYFMPGEKEFLFPNHPVFSYLESKMQKKDRFISFGEKIPANVFMHWNISTPEGLDPIYSYQYGQLIYTARNKGKITESIPRVEVKIFNPDEGRDILSSPMQYKLLSLLGIKYIAYHRSSEEKVYLSPDKIFPKPYFSLLSKKDGWSIYQFNKSLPRAFLADSYIVSNNFQQTVDKLYSENFKINKTLILEKKLNKPLTRSNKKDSVKIAQYSSQKVVLKTDTSGPKLLFLSDNYYPGWTAYLDDKKTEILKADGSFRSVYLPKGKHTIIMKYEPQIFYYGASITLISILMIIVIMLYDKGKRKAH